MSSNILSAVEQGQLPLARKPETPAVPLEIILKKKDMLGAINLSIDISGLDDKEIYIPLDIDPGHFTNIRRGKQNANWPTNKFNALCDLCGNEIPLLWWAHSRGKGLVLLKSEAERQLEAEHEARVKAEEKLAYAEELLGRR